MVCPQISPDKLPAPPRTPRTPLPPANDGPERYCLTLASFGLDYMTDKEGPTSWLRRFTMHGSIPPSIYFQGRVSSLNVSATVGAFSLVLAVSFGEHLKNAHLYVLKIPNYVSQRRVFTGYAVALQFKVNNALHCIPDQDQDSKNLVKMRFKQTSYD